MQNYVPMLSILPSQLPNFTNNSVAESKGYAILQGTELSRGEYQQLNK